MNLKAEIRILSFFYLITAILWIIFIFYTNHSGLYEGKVFEFVLKPFLIGMTIIPILGGYFGIKKAKSWGGFKSTLGKGMIFVSLGTLSWGLAMIVWNYYLFIKGVEIPYPSLADLFFVSIWALWTYGMYNIGKVSGAKYGLKETWGKIAALIESLVVVIVSYYLLFVVARQGIFDLGGGIIQTTLGFLYPLGDIVILMTAMSVYLLSKKFLGGKFKNPILLLLLCFVLNYIADFMFVFTTSGENPTYFNGHIVDILYTTIMFMASLGILLIDPNRLQENQQKEN